MHVAKQSEQHTPVGRGSPQRRLAAGLASATLVSLVALRHGLATSTDSAAYYAASRSLAAGHGLRMPTGELFHAWPPFVPGLCALFQLCGLTATHAFVLCNALAAALTAGLGVSLLDRTSSDPWVRRGGTLALVAGFPLLHIYAYAWSEAWFVAWTTAAMVALQRYVERLRTADLLICAVAIALACLTRYVGVALIASAMLTIVMRNRGPSHAMLALTSFGLITALPLAVWLARNRALTGTLAGAREGSQLGLLEGAIGLLGAVGAWFIPEPLPEWMRALMAFLVMLVLGALLWPQLRAPTIDARGATLRVAATVLIMYPSCLLVLSAVIAFDRPDQRLVVVLFVPMVLLSASAAEAMLERVGRTRSMIVTGLWLAYLSAASAFVAWYYGYRGGGFAAPEWRNSPDRPLRDGALTPRPAVQQLAGAVVSAGDARGVFPSRPQVG